MPQNAAGRSPFQKGSGLLFRSVHRQLPCRAVSGILISVCGHTIPRAHTAKSTAQGLVWGIQPGSADWQALEAAAAPFGIALRAVAPRQADSTVSRLLGGSGKALSQPAQSLPQVPALVLAGIKDPALDEFLEALKASGVNIPLKALATATNLAWPFSRLLTELAGEHAALTGNRV